MYSFSHRDQQNVLLLTVVAPFKYEQLTTDANILFRDEGAQRSFISNNLAENLYMQLKPSCVDEEIKLTSLVLVTYRKGEKGSEDEAFYIELLIDAD